jgi:CRISPR-associated protein Cas6
MYWQEDRTNKVYVVPDDIVDVAFGIACPCLPVDHAHALSQALLQALPWLQQEQHAGIHLIHGAESGHGWQRPEAPDKELLHLSRRTKMTLRLPKQRIADAKKMTGMTLEINGYPLQVGRATVRPLSTLSTLFSRYVISRADEDEEQFVRRVAIELEQLGISVRKLLCGKSHVIALPEGQILTRRLMVADLKAAQSVKLQQRGLGPGRKIGCGLFIPHKGVEAVNNDDDT